MILLVGLGNPGPRYSDTRHNIGFLAIDAFAHGRGVSLRERFGGAYGEFGFGPVPVGLLKPGTFMNDSGRSVRAALAFLGIKPADVLVVHDELDIPFGELRLKQGGGDGGHRGLRSISAELGSPAYGRLRLGIGRPPPDFDGSVADFVLQAFAFEERGELGNVLGRASKVVESVISDGLDQAMNRTNQRTVR